MLTLNLFWIIFIVLIWISSLCFFRNKYKKEANKRLKDISVRFKLIVEESIKDKKIGENEYNDIRNAILDLEAEILK